MLKNLKIGENTHILLKKYCKKNHLKMNEFASYILEKYMKDIGESKCISESARIVKKK